LVLAAFNFWALRLYDPNMAAYHTGAQEKLRIELPDNSVVYLNSGSTLRVAKKWEAGTQREVWLKGEAFFNVKHGPEIGSAKFSVHTAGAKVEVLGTQFNVYERAEQTKVVLNLGKIKLELKEQEQTVVMQPGDMVEFSQASRTVTRKQVKPQLYTSWKESQIVFDETPLREIIILVENSFRVQVRVEDSALLDRKMTFKLQENDLDLLLEAISKTFNLQIKRQAGQVIIMNDFPETLNQ
jgi:ferric-dicitrate binding protein FerR (iron transport regulator)